MSRNGSSRQSHNAQPNGVLFRPLHNDRYVWTAPNNPKKLFLDPDAVVAPCKKKQKLVNAPHPLTLHVQTNVGVVKQFLQTLSGIIQ
ncbi:hypothetical protein PISMIDRAFT_16810 [Pisolithus microcarpus 441]|uniref:Uncharacterized protein n=1 Tax=Pisolithus microcarpus 441 TaxID=765257 RepID=A0A0C9Z4Z8_9AGAM|nr:hypothetical protein PISMIDRAFT_16810 [Pisolithus microcarpus 441]